MQQSSVPAQSLLSAHGIVKTFDRTRALSGANFELAEGEIHGLLGANGAGKSTLSKVIAGHYVPDSGELVFHRQPLRLRGARDALRAGITIVMQETTLVPDLTVLENIFLPELGKHGRFDIRALRNRSREILDSLGQADSLAFDQKVRQLSSAQKQLVEIAKALGVAAKVLIFDEPTASLSPSEVERLFDIMERLRSTGHGLIFVSHRLEEVFSITDRVTVMREGRTVLAGEPTAGLNQADLIRAMVGTDIGPIYEQAGSETTISDDRPVALAVKHLASAPTVRDVSFSVREGEILGLGGLVGAGRSETVEAIFGLRHRTSGEVLLDGKALKANDPQKAIRAGLGFVAEDRLTQNIVPDLSVRENLLLAYLGGHNGFFRSYHTCEQKVKQLLKQLGLPEERLTEQSMLNFSGGMQQKIIIARWLIVDPKVLILDEPTKGVDIGTRASIYTMLRHIAKTGVAIVMVSSDFEEILGLCDRIVVVSDGRSVADLPSNVLDEEKLTVLAAPRTSMQRNTDLLTELTGKYGGAGFWALLEGEQLICLNSVVRDPKLDPGFGPGDARTFSQTAIPLALGQRAYAFVSEQNDGRHTLLVPMRSTRGHDLGWVGLSMDTAAELPPVEAIRSRVNTIAFHL